MKELIIGCGQRTGEKLLYPSKNKDYQNPVTLDINPEHCPDVVHNLEVLPLPFGDNEFDEIHAYEILEHTGNLGDYEFFFAQFSDFWRILKPAGVLYAIVPAYSSLWAFGDPSHKRVINKGTLIFLGQKNYEKQVGKTPMTDFRYIYKADFDVIYSKETDTIFCFALRAIGK
jgi:hypothetical protein